MRFLIGLPLLAALVAGCPETPVGNDDADAGVVDAGDPPPPFAISTHNRLAWKRQRALETDLMAALDLAKDELCSELGLYSCVDFVHLVPLGGNEPFARSQYEPLPSPTVTTPIAFDRVALSACATRADKDIAGDGVVFASLDFDAAAVDDATAAPVLEGLGKRLLGRALTPGEIEEFTALTVDDDGAAVSPRDFAILSCFAIATMSETIFY
ncbi:MAG: hypothetical protein Q8O67_24025 [Deltaproteobacteria bacterium]|nr:hypothetical protein [Deltaproteobacteria bacterium]